MKLLIHKSVSKLLLDWYQKNKRDLPWRRTHDAYCIWVSEVMLQQTQVKTVIPYYQKFIERFPTLSSLIATPLEEVIGYWSGLGYYRRIRHFYQACQEIQKNYQGMIPQNHQELIQLPGVGDYISCAVASIAFNQGVPVIDGNVERVYARVYVLEGDPKYQPCKKQIKLIAEKSVDIHNPGDFNQAIMDLGATVCTPMNPLCGKCPLKKICKAHQTKKELFFPQKKAKPAIQKISQNGIIYLNKKQKIFLVQRKYNSVMKDLWEIPIFQNTDHLKLEKMKIWKKFKNSIMNHRYETQIYIGNDSLLGKIKIKQGRWFSASELELLALTGLTKKVLNLFLKQSNH